LFFLKFKKFSIISKVSNILNSIEKNCGKEVGESIFVYYIDNINEIELILDDIKNNQNA
jgi:hypothetical protein